MEAAAQAASARVLVKLAALLTVALAEEALQADYYLDETCSGAVEGRLWRPLGGCHEALDGMWSKITCNDTWVTVTYYRDASCTQKHEAPAASRVLACIHHGGLRWGKITCGVSVYTVAYQHFSASGCVESNMVHEGVYNYALGCTPDGTEESGAWVARSTKHEHGPEGTLVVTEYSAKDCTGDAVKTNAYDCAGGCQKHPELPDMWETIIEACGGSMGTDVGWAPQAQTTLLVCECKKAWQDEIAGKNCNEWCCNPDGDPNGEWCYVKDVYCEDSGWGYCRDGRPDAGSRGSGAGGSTSTGRDSANGPVGSPGTGAGGSSTGGNSADDSAGSPGSGVGGSTSIGRGSMDGSAGSSSPIDGSAKGFDIADGSLDRADLMFAFGMSVLVCIAAMVVCKGYRNAQRKDAEIVAALSTASCAGTVRPTMVLSAGAVPAAPLPPLVTFGSATLQFGSSVATAQAAQAAQAMQVT